MHNLLAIDTSSEACSVALSIKDEVLQRHLRAPLKHAELLLPAVHSLLDEADTTLNKMDALVFGRGPGAFTSLRIGIGVVQGLAWGADLPVVPVSSLAAVAHQAVTQPGDTKLHYVLVAMDARMGEVFHCTFAVSDDMFLLPVSPESVSPPAAVTASEPGLTVGAGNGFERYAELQLLGGTLKSVRAELLPHAAALIPLAKHWLQRHEPLPAKDAQPIYVRNQVAEKPASPTSEQSGIK